MRTNFFATTADLITMVGRAETGSDLKYVCAGTFETSEVDAYLTATALPDLGIALHGDANHEAYYLVASRDCSIAVRPIPQRRGGVRYAIDQALNPSTIVFWPCGSFRTEAIIGGQVTAVGGSGEARELYQRFRRAIAASFERVGEDYIGREAMEHARQGIRLTSSVRSPRTYDLAVVGAGPSAKNHA